MKRRPFILFFLVYLISSFLRLESANEFFFSRLGVRNGLSQTSVLCMYQDHAGYLWFGTRGGANKYDGYRFQIFQNETGNPQSLSDGYIFAINEDKNKNIWLATLNGLNCIDHETGEIIRFYPQDIVSTCKSNEIRHFLKHHNGDLYAFSTDMAFKCNADKSLTPQPLLQEITSEIHSITQLSNGNICVGTALSGLYIYKSDWELHINYTNFDKIDLNKVIINALAEPDEQHVILGTEANGIYIYNRTDKSLIHLDQNNSGLSNNKVSNLLNYKEGKILIGTFAGLNLLNMQTYEITSIKINPEEKGGLSHYSITSLLLDHTNTLWVGTYSAGVNFYSPYFKPSSVITPENMTGVIGRGQEDKDGNIWFATEGAGLLFYNPLTMEQKIYPLKSVSMQNYEENFIKSILLKDNYIYCGTLWGEIYRFNITNKTYKKIYSFENYNIQSLHLDSMENLWVLSNNKQSTAIIKDGKINYQLPVNSTNQSLSYTTVMKELSMGKFLIGTSVNSLYVYDKTEKTLVDIGDRIKPAGNHETVGIISDIEEAQGYIWVSTTKSGLYKFDKELIPVKQYRPEHGLPGSYVGSLIVDGRDDIWATTGNQIYKLNRSEDWFQLIEPGDMRRQDYTLYSGFAASSGIIYFPGNSAIHTFEPQSLIMNPHIPQVYITGIVTDNRVDITNLYLKRKEIYNNRYTYYMTLPHTIGNLGIQYTAINFIHANENEFMYKLEGYDKDWIKAGNRRTAYYRNISPGKYIFKLKAGNIDGVWTPYETLLHVTVKPPFYKTGWAFLFYVLFISGTIWKVMQYHHQKKDLRREIKYRRMEKNKMKELHEERMRMFQSFSHELRTPLTLIINPLNELLEHVAFSTEIKNTLRLMKKNTDRLLLLVNNLMDIQKYEAGKYTLNKQSFNFSHFIRGIYQTFEDRASSRKIHFYLHNNLPAEHMVYYDEKEIEKVLFNLLSNSLKFTPTEGSVTITTDILEKRACLQLENLPDHISPLLTVSHYLYIEVSDTGMGFPETDALKIFSPFYQSRKDLHGEISGTGIGLSLTRSIINQHEGYIWATSIPEKESRFFILLPNRKDENQLQTETVKIVSEPEKEVKTEDDWIRKVEEMDKKHILIVDDNPDILEYLERQFKDEYIIHKAVNGRDALEKIKIAAPDIVISDIIMPEMNGLELCKRIKENPKLCHIPIILLTSRTSASQIVQGYDAEADDYFKKPFQIPLLKARLKNILASRDKIKSTYEENIDLKAFGVETTDEKDHFMKKFIEIVKENLSNSNLDMTVFYDAFNMSRPTFYRKVKQFTDLTPAELVTKIRLDMATRILKDTSLSITEVAQKVGFNSRSYFTKTFKKFYGMSPKEYQKKL